jgi:hypothetical protein
MGFPSGGRPARPTASKASNGSSPPVVIPGIQTGGGGGGFTFTLGEGVGNGGSPTSAPAPLPIAFPENLAVGPPASSRRPAPAS